MQPVGITRHSPAALHSPHFSAVSADALATRRHNCLIGTRRDRRNIRFRTLSRPSVLIPAPMRRPSGPEPHFCRSSAVTATWRVQHRRITYAVPMSRRGLASRALFRVPPSRVRAGSIRYANLTGVAAGSRHPNVSTPYVADPRREPLLDPPSRATGLSEGVSSQPKHERIGQ